MSLVLNVLRVFLGFLYVGTSFWLALAALLLLLPFRQARVYVTSVWAKSVGWVCLWLSGVELEIIGRERLLGAPPAMYVCNHVSLLDVLIAMWITPVGTTAVAKREVIWFPFVGLVYALSGSLRVDRSNRTSAVTAMDAQARFLRKSALSVVIWPEGTRSRTGCLLPFKKGFAHVALQTRLPIVPIVISGAHRAWRVGGFRIQHGTRVRIEITDPISTSHWTREQLDEQIESVARVFRDRLPADQQPVDGR